jgi:hypothetical protein
MRDYAYVSRGSKYISVTSGPWQRSDDWYTAPVISTSIYIFALAAAGFSQRSPDPELFCRYSIPAEQRVTRAAPDGFSVTVRRKADPALAKDACVVEVRDRAKRIVFAREGFNSRLHEDSGRDIDNDGSPDLIVGVEAYRTKLCCSEYSILSLRPAPHVVGTFANPTFRVDQDRRTVVWAALPFDDLASDFGPAPTNTVVGQYRDGRFADLTSENCGWILAGTAPGWASLSEDLWRLDGSRRAASRAETAPPSLAVETTRASATTVVLQMLYCGKDAEARDLIRQVWPDQQQEAVRASLTAAVAAARRR